VLRNQYIFHNFSLLFCSRRLRHPESPRTAFWLVSAVAMMRMSPSEGENSVTR